METSKFSSHQNPSKNLSTSPELPLKSDSHVHNLHEKGEKRNMSSCRQQLSACRRSNNNSHGKRFLGVRQRPSGRWVAEIKDSSQKLRLWLGTFDRAEEAARTYDSAARLLRGRNAKTNFAYHGRGIMMNTLEEDYSCSVVRKNPRLSQLLQHAIQKNQLASSTSLNSFKIPPDHDDPIHFETLVEETIFCSPTTTASDRSYDNDQNTSSSSSSSSSYKHCHGLSSFGSSKVYSSVIVAPSFSASLGQAREEENNKY